MTTAPVISAQAYFRMGERSRWDRLRTYARLAGFLALTASIFVPLPSIAAVWTDVFQSTAAASACAALVKMSKEDNQSEVLQLSVQIEQLVPTLPTPDAKILAHLCRLRAWSTLSTTDSTMAAAALADARAAAASATDTFRDALVLTAAVWAMHADAPKGSVDDELTAASKLDAMQIDRASRVQGLRADTVARQLAKAAFERRLRPQALELASSAVEISRERFGASSVKLAEVIGRIALYAMQVDPPLAREWGERSLTMLAAADSKDMAAAAPLRISISADLLVRANTLDNSGERMHWMRRMLDETERVSALPADNEARVEVLEEWSNLIKLLENINQVPEKQRSLEAALKYASASGLSKWHAKLLVQSAESQILAAQVMQAQATIKALKVLLAGSGSMATRPEDSWRHLFVRKELPRLERGMLMLTEDVAPPTNAIAPPLQSLGETISLVTFPLKPGMPVAKWIDGLASLSAFDQRKHVEQAFAQVLQAKMQLPAEDRSLLAAAKIGLLIDEGDTSGAQALASDKRWLPPPIGARWKRTDQAIWMERLATISDVSGNVGDALVRYEQAWQLWQPNPPARALAVLLHMGRLQGSQGSASGLQVTAERLRTMQIAPDLATLHELIRSLTEARLANIQRSPESARAAMVLAMQQYVVMEVPLNRLASSAAMRAMNRPSGVSAAELGVLRQLLIDLVALEDSLCIPEPDVALDHLLGLSLANQRIDGASPRRYAWQDRLHQANSRAGDRSLLIDLVVRAFESGLHNAAAAKYPEIQRLQSQAEDVFPSLAASTSYANRVLSILDAAAVERVLLSNRPERVSSLLDGDWADENVRVPMRSAFYGPTALESIQADRKTVVLPGSLVHFLTYESMLRGGLCHADNLKHPQVAAVILRDGRFVSIRRVGSLEDVERLSNDWLAVLQQAALPSVESPAGLRLYNMLLRGPLAELGPQHLLNIRLEGDIPVLPWAVMLHQYAPSPSSGMPVRMLPSASKLADLLQTPAARGQPVVFAAPAYGVPTEGIPPLDPLLWSLREGKLVAQMIGARLQSDEQASTLELARVRKPSILHISSHTKPVQSMGLREAITDRLATAGEDSARILLALTGTRIALANANQPGQGLAHGGTMSALMMSALNLRGTQLATLSMCSSSVAVDRVGIAAPSLQWAAHQAGAKSVVASLWDVDDAATMAFMGVFYEAIRQGMPPAQALLRAQSTFRSHPDRADWRSPRYWGAFVVSGTNEPVLGLREDQDIDAPTDRSRAALRLTAD